MCPRPSFVRAETLGLLEDVTHLRLEPAWSTSCYTYYDKPGSYMGEHCDKFDACRIAFLFYLDAAWPQAQAPGPGLQLLVFRGDNSRTELLLRITARSNRAIIPSGAEQAHYRPLLAPGESLILLAGCFRLALAQRQAGRRQWLLCTVPLPSPGRPRRIARIWHRPLDAAQIR